MSQERRHALGHFRLTKTSPARGCVNNSPRASQRGFLALRGWTRTEFFLVASVHIFLFCQEGEKETRMKLSVVCICAQVVFLSGLCVLPPFDQSHPVSQARPILSVNFLCSSSSGCDGQRAGCDRLCWLCEEVDVGPSVF